MGLALLMLVLCATLMLPQQEKPLIMLKNHGRDVAGCVYVHVHVNRVPCLSRNSFTFHMHGESDRRRRPHTQRERGEESPVCECVSTKPISKNHSETLHRRAVEA